MTNLRKSLYSVMDMPKKYFEELFRVPVFKGVVTEKTDGFAVEVGYDPHFYIRTGSSDKIREEGEFFKFSVERLFSKEPGERDYNPKIALRQELAFHFLKNNWKLENKLSYDTNSGSLVGEMILCFDGKPYCPNQTNYAAQYFGKYGGFILHSRHPGNFHLTPNEIEDISELGDDTFKFDNDICHERRVILKVPEQGERSEADYREWINHIFLQHFKHSYSKWNTSVAPEGYVIHTPTYAFKVMIPPYKPSLREF